MKVTFDRLAVVLSILLIAAPVATATSAGVSSTDQTDLRSNPTAGESPHEQLQQQTSSNNSSVRQEHPDEAEEEGNTTNLRRWLSVRIGDSLVGCAQRVQTEANTSCESLEEEFPSLDSRYGDLAESTEESDDDNVSRVLNQTATDQYTFVAEVGEYRSTLAAYREARQQNDTAEARRLARQTSRQSDRVVTVGERLITEYDIILGNSTIAVEPAREITAEVVANVSNTTTEIRTSEFDSPELQFSSNASQASFAEPVALQGRLQTENGTPLVNRTVEVNTSERTYRTQTGSDGEFAVTYRPTTAPTGSTTVTASYRPRDDAQYTETEAQLPLTVRATEGTIRLNSTSTEAAFGENVTTQGQLHVDETGVAGVPITVTLDGVHLADIETNESGHFTATGQVPANVSTGPSPLNVSVAQQQRAVDAEPESTDVQIDQRTPRLVASTERIDADTVRIFGSMTVDQIPVSGAVLQIRHEGETLNTVRVDESGAYETTAPLPDVPANESTTVTVNYEPPGGNLEPLTLEVPVTTAPSSGIVPNVDDELSLFESLPWGSVDPLSIAVGALAFLFVLLVTAGTAYGSELRLELEAVGDRLGIVGALLGIDSGQESEGELDDVAPGTTDDRSVEKPDSGVVLLDTARDRLSRGQMDDAVVAAYNAARRQLDARFGIEPSLTHWELLAVYRDFLDNESRTALERLTTAYEQAAFSPTESTTDTASRAIESADTIVEYGTSPQQGEPHADD